MIMKNKLKYIGMLFLLIAMGCNEEDRTDLIDSSGDAPAEITNIQITPTPGGGLVKYDVPNDANFLYAKAVYEAPAGIIREARASRYENTIILEGFGDTDLHNVKFYSVGKNEKETKAIEVSFNPLRPAIFDVAEKLVIRPTFGGIELFYDNPIQSDLIFELFIDESGTGEKLTPLNKLYTRISGGRWVTRGLEAVETNFVVVINDPFGNKTQKIKATLTPFFEIEIPKTNFKDLRLPTDATALRTQNPITMLWDGKTSPNSNFYATDQGVNPMPKWISLDFGNKFVLSRLKMWQRYGSEYSEGNLPTDWEIYGSNNPNPDGSWASWTKIDRFGAPYKPSGLPWPQRTAEDVTYAQKGIDYELSNTPEGYRYYRFKWYDTYDSRAFVIIAEMSFFGQFAQ